MIKGDKLVNIYKFAKWPSIFLFRFLDVRLKFKTKIVAKISGKTALEGRNFIYNFKIVLDMFFRPKKSVLLFILKGLLLGIKI